MEFSDIIKKLTTKQDLTSDECKFAMQKIMSGESDPVLTSAFLVALKMKGETPVEIASLVWTMREFSEKIKIDGLLIDTCGTGGGEVKTFNISTAAMFVVAGAGITIAKHGNKAITSQAGSADVLEALGVKIDLMPEKVKECIEAVGVGFMFAPIFHKAMKNVMPVRKTLGIRTIFNILGPLTNPANTQGQVLGVFEPELTEKLAEVLKIIGVKKAFVVHGLEGLDEISTVGETKVSELNNNEIKNYIINPQGFGIKQTSIEYLKGGNKDYNARLIKEILDPTKSDSPARDIVLLNAAAGIVVGGKANSIEEGLKLAQESVTSGKAQEKLLDLVKFCQSC